MHHSIILFYFILLKPIYLNTHTHTQNLLRNWVSHRLLLRRLHNSKTALENRLGVALKTNHSHTLPE